jgi:uncharacterized SAM-binding protein YcdF (DUF218 family)
MAVVLKAMRMIRAGWKSLSVWARRRLLIAGILLVSMDILVVAHEPLLTWFAYQFRAEDPPVGSDAIVMLIGGPADRPGRAAEIYRQGLAPVILMGQTSEESGETESHHRALIDCGVPAEAIAILPGEVVGSTHDEAVRMSEYVRSHPIRRILVVTSAYHSARVGWTFRKVLQGLGVEVRMVVSQDPRFNETDWYTNEYGLRLYLSEAMKSVYYWFTY